MQELNPILDTGISVFPFVRHAQGPPLVESRPPNIGEVQSCY